MKTETDIRRSVAAAFASAAFGAAEKKSAVAIHSTTTNGAAVAVEWNGTTVRCTLDLVDAQALLFK